MDCAGGAVCCGGCASWRTAPGALLHLVERGPLQRLAPLHVVEHGIEGVGWREPGVALLARSHRQPDVLARAPAQSSRVPLRGARAGTARGRGAWSSAWRKIYT